MNTHKCLYLLLWIPIILWLIISVLKFTGEWTREREHLESHHKNELMDYYDHLMVSNRKLRYLFIYQTNEYTGQTT